jgi:hypothetical protein
VLIRSNLSGTRVNPFVLGKCAHVRWSRPTQKGEIGHICDYAWRPFLDWSEIPSRLDLGSDYQRQTLCVFCFWFWRNVEISSLTSGRIMRQQYLIRCLLCFRPQTRIVSPIDLDFMWRGHFRHRCFGWLFPLEAPQPRNRALPLVRKPGSNKNVRDNNESRNCAQYNVPVDVKNIDHGFHQPAMDSAILWQRSADQEHGADGKNADQTREIDFIN